MHVICSYCRADLGERPPYEIDKLSHGMCEDCLAHYLKQWRGMSLSEYLDGLSGEALAVDTEGRVAGVSERLAERLGIDRDATTGLLAGEVVECVYARRPEGCGRTIHCAVCAIRNTFTAAQESGEPQLDVPATLRLDTGTAQLKISAFPDEGFVRLVVDTAQMPGD